MEDSAHTRETTRAALEGFSGFVGVGSFFIVEGGCVDVEEMRLTEAWPRGVLPALHEWLETRDGRKFEVRRDPEIYGISCYPEGFVERVVE